MIGILKSDEAVSESVGYIILVGILVTVVSIVLMIGYPIFQSSIQEGHMQNMQEAFYLLSANANKVAMYESPTQSAELQLNGGALSINDTGFFEITYYDSSNNIIGTNNTTNLIVMEYKLGDNTVAYILGGVCSGYGYSSTMLSKPSMYEYTNTDGHTTIVVPVTTFQNSIGAIGGTGTVRVIINSPYYSKTLNSVSYPAAVHYDYVYHISIRMKSDYNQCFKAYFENTLGFTEVSDSDGVFEVKKDYSDPATLYVVPSKISVNIE